MLQGRLYYTEDSPLIGLSEDKLGFIMFESGLEGVSFKVSYIVCYHILFIIKCYNSYCFTCIQQITYFCNVDHICFDPGLYIQMLLEETS